MTDVLPRRAAVDIAPGPASTVVTAAGGNAAH